MFVGRHNWRRLQSSMLLDLTADSPQLAVNYVQRPALRLLPTAYCLLPTAYCSTAPCIGLRPFPAARGDRRQRLV
jgi:hypothetical protein